MWQEVRDVKTNQLLASGTCDTRNTHEIHNPLMSNDPQRRRAVSPLKIKIPIKKSRQAELRGGIE
jgi:hypothetical protein